MKEEMLIALSHTLKGFLTETSATKVIQKALHRLDDYLNADYSYLALQNKETSYLDILFSHGISQTALKKFHKKIGCNTIAKIFFKEAFTVVKKHDAAEDYNELKIEDDYEMCVVLHIGWGGRTFGYLACYFDKEFNIDLSTKNFLLAMAGACSAALEKEELLNIIRELKQFDSETGIYSHRFFLAKLEDEIYKASVNKYGLALVIMDMDNYKQNVNTYGSETAHLLLKETAEELKTFLRGSDVLGSLGIDEFILYMPKTDIDKAFGVIKNFAEHLKSKTFTTYNIKTSFSFGITAIENSGDTVEKIIHRAQLALYNARKQGRGHICIQK